MSLNPIYDIYYRRYRTAFRLGSYSGFIRGFCSEPIAIHVSGESSLVKDTYRRLMSTRLFMQKAIVDGLDSPDVLLAFEHMNAMHKQIPVEQEHFLYLIANLILDPIRLLYQLNKVRLTKDERINLLSFWGEFTMRMGIQHAPVTFLGWLRLRNHYENKYRAYTEPQRRLLKVCLQEVPKLSLPYVSRWPFLCVLPWLIPARMRKGFNLNMPKVGLCFLWCLSFSLRFK